MLKRKNTSIKAGELFSASVLATPDCHFLNPSGSLVVPLAMMSSNFRLGRFNYIVMF